MPKRFPPQSLTECLTLISLGIFGLGCGSGGGDPSPGRELAIQLSERTASVVQGSALEITSTVTWTGGGDAGVTLQLEGVPTGINASQGLLPTGPGVYGQRLTFTPVAIGPGNYPITVRAVAPGFTDATEVFTLTVTELFFLSVKLTPSSLTIGQGGTDLSIASLIRTVIPGPVYSGTVNLSLSGAPAGISHFVSPEAVVGNSAVVSVTVPPATPPGTYNLVLRAQAQFLADRVVTLPVTVVPPPPDGFMLAMSSSNVVLSRGTTGTVTITILRNGFNGEVSLTIGAPLNVTNTFAPATTTGTVSVLTIQVGPNTAAGLYNLGITGTAAGRPTQHVVLRLTVQE